MRNKDFEPVSYTHLDAADNLLKAEKEILEANKRDVATAEENMKAKSMIDRLSLDHDRLLGMADGLRQIAKLADPIGEVIDVYKRQVSLLHAIIITECFNLNFKIPGLID